jgi:pimeloyl-ACP methyl ester carboxylesterase
MNELKIKRTAFFKKPKEGKEWMENWVAKMEASNARSYTKISIETALGKTQVYGLNLDENYTESIVIFPGFRTSTLFWDFEKGLDVFKDKALKIYLVETNGQPNLSSGHSPDIKGDGYGIWANEVLEQLGIKKTFVAGASFGALVCMKLARTNPEKIKAAFLLNAGCFRMISFGFKNLYYNLLPIFFPSRKNIALFFENIVFCGEHHRLSSASSDTILDFMQYVITSHKDKTQKPYPMGAELSTIKTPVHLLFGANDVLIPYEKSLKNAERWLSSIESVKVFPNVGHGIETYQPAIKEIKRIISNYIDS